MNKKDTVRTNERVQITESKIGMAERYSPVILIIRQLSDITPSVSCISYVFYDHHVHSTSDISKIHNCLQNTCHTYSDLYHTYPPLI